MAAGTQRRMGSCELRGQECVMKELQHELAPDRLLDEVQGGSGKGALRR